MKKLLLIAMIVLIAGCSLSKATIPDVIAPKSTPLLSLNVTSKETYRLPLREEKALLNDIRYRLPLREEKALLNDI